MLTPTITPAKEVISASSFPKGNPSFVTQLWEAIRFETHLISWVKVTLERAENCDATLAISSHGQITYLQIKEQWWKDIQANELLDIIWYISATPDEKENVWDIWDHFAKTYYFENDGTTERNRTVEILQESVVSLIKIAHFINQAIAIGLWEKNTWKSLKITKQSSVFKFLTFSVKLQMPQWLESETKKDFYSDKFLKNVSDYINDRVKTIQRRDQHEHQ